jgi:L-fuculose-phosphate aldolase
VSAGAESLFTAVSDPEGPVQKSAKYAGDSMSDTVNEPLRRKRFAQVGADLFASGAVTSHGGNLSETDGEYIWISRTNSMLGHMDRGDVIRTTWEPSDSDVDCSRELIVHRAIYHALAELHEQAGQPFAGAAIVHAHTTNTIFRSLIEDEIEMVESEGKFTIDGPVKVFAPEVSIASPEAAEMLAGAVREGAKVAVLRGHGPFAVADDLFGAQRLVSVLEQSATVANLRDATGKAFL